MSEAEVFFEALVASVSGGPVAIGSMFGSRAFLVNGKAVGCVKGDVFAVKLGAGLPAHATAMTLPRAALFDPSGKHRPFKDWVAVPVVDPEDDAFASAAALLDAAIAHALA